MYISYLQMNNWIRAKQKGWSKSSVGTVLKKLKEKKEEFKTFIVYIFANIIASKVFKWHET
jgi:hypothetical protein